MPDFSQGKVYRILQDGLKTVYIGSTTQTLSARMAGHRKGLKQWPNYKLYKLISEVGIEHFSIELVVDCPCDRREILNRAEGEQIRIHNTITNGCNSQLAGRTMAEWQRLPEVKAKKVEYLRRPDVKVKITAKAAEYYQRPEVKARFAEYTMRPDVKIKTLERQQSPEYKEVARKYRQRQLQNKAQAKSIANKYANIKRPELIKLCIARQLHMGANCATPFRYTGVDQMFHSKAFHNLKVKHYMEMLNNSDAAAIPQANVEAEVNTVNALI